MYPLAFGFINSETEDNWTWFMTQLRKAIREPKPLAVCTDACKGLEKSVRNVFNGAEQRECFFHLMQNFIKRFHGFGKMYPAARTYRTEVFKEHMTTIFKDAPEVWNWLRDYHNLKWMRCSFNPAIKCDYITNNVAEVFNNWIKDIKDLPVVDLADKLREMIMVLWRRRRRIGERLQGRILPAVKLQLKAATRGLGHLKVVPAGDWSTEVWDNSTGHARHRVELHRHTCTCCEWQHTSKPCQHALAFITTQRNVDVCDFVDECYSVEKFKAAYCRLIEPMTDKSQWSEVEVPFCLKAPLGKRNVGRQRKNRIKGCLEAGGNSGELSRGKAAAAKNDGKKMVRGPVTCPNHGLKGHRKTSYKCPLNGTRKRLRKPRKNTTKNWPHEASTPERSAREEILQNSPVGSRSCWEKVLLPNHTCPLYWR
ncbi:uncharacterized protein LOC102708026 isoform X2 [Oryza brachyantha]|uniref:uncharacterized protein LOC102708026 isoform X2 n=1 Tax=Oryza brachyantha TaxID=4533 RepID=UPI00077630A7|nr:uncharacterized protein LOC102708026 isoform X2 [Oryza brachyantha]